MLVHRFSSVTSDLRTQLSSSIRTWKVQSIAISVFYLAIIVDALIGGGLLIHLFAVHPEYTHHMSLFYISMITSSFLFILIWRLSLSHFQHRLQLLFIFLFILESLIVALLLLLFLFPMVWVFILLAPLFFNTLSFALYSLSSIVLTYLHPAFLPNKGLFIGSGGAAALLVSASILQVLPLLSSPFFQILLLIGLTFLLQLPVLVVLVFNWETFLHHGIYVVTRRDKPSFYPLSLFKSERMLLYTIISLCFFLAGSGLSSAAMILADPRIVGVDRAIGFLAAAVFLFFFATLSDALGSIVFLLGAILLNSISQFLILYTNNVVLASALEISGYYVALAFITIKLSEVFSTRIAVLIAVVWGSGYAADFVGFLTAAILYSFHVPLPLMSLISLVFMILALLLLFLSSPPPSMTRIFGLYIFKCTGQRLYSLGCKDPIHDHTADLVTALISAVQQLTDILFQSNNIRHVELYDGTRAIVARSQSLGAAVLVQNPSTEIELLLYRLLEDVNEVLGRFSTEKLSLQELKTLIDPLVKQYFGNLPELSSALLSVTT